MTRLKAKIAKLTPSHLTDAKGGLCPAREGCQISESEVALVTPAAPLPDLPQMSSPFAENISLRAELETPLLSRASRLDPRGAYRDRHGRWARDAMAACRAQDERMSQVDAEVVAF